MSSFTLGPTKQELRFYKKTLLSSSPTLLSDGFATPGGSVFGLHGGLKSTANVANCLDSKIRLQPNPNKTFASFKGFLDESFQNKKSVVLSAEDFDNPGLDRDRLLNFFRGRWQSVLIVVTYRRLDEWYHSLHFQLHRRTESEYQGFVDWIRKYLEGENDLLAGSLVRERYRATIDDRKENISISVLNYHSFLPLEEAFFCQQIPRAIATCSHVRKNTKPAPPANTGHSLEFKRLAIAAKGMGAVGPELGVNQLTSIVEKNKKELGFEESRYNNPNWHCLSADEEEKFFQASLKEEIDMVPEWFEEQGGEDSLRRHFADFIAKGSLCSLNVTLVLSNASLIAHVFSAN